MCFGMSPQYQFHDQHLAKITGGIAGYTVYTDFATINMRIWIMVTRTTRSPAAKTAPVRKPIAGKTALVKQASKPEKKHKKDKKTGDKAKVVRDSFTMPQSDYALIATLKERVNGVHVKKSELLRAGLRLLSKLTAAQLKKSVADLEKIKTGRPKKD
jgi:hypothetical protein